MQKARSFEDLAVYQRARELTNKIYEITKRTPFSRDFNLVNQVRSSAVSIMSNIAEGFERETNPEFIRFLYISKGSSGEARAQLTIARDQEYIDSEVYQELVTRFRTISGMLANLIVYLRESCYRRSKH